MLPVEKTKVVLNRSYRGSGIAIVASLIEDVADALYHNNVARKANGDLAGKFNVYIEFEPDEP